MWALLSDEQKQTYGEEYFEQALRSLEKYTNVVNLLNVNQNQSDLSAFCFPIIGCRYLTSRPSLDRRLYSYVPIAPLHAGYSR